MKKHALAIAVGALAASVVVTAALAYVVTIFGTGKVAGAPDSFVSVKVVKKNGVKPIAIKAFTARKVPAHCDGGAGTVSQRFGKTLPLDASRRFSGKVSSSGGPGGFFKLSGKVGKGGRKVTGTLSIDKSFDPPLGECRTGTKSWSTAAFFPPD
jgi:hypothetical protein